MHIPPDWGVFGGLIVSFLVFWFIFGRLFFGPFLKLLGDRERRMRELSERTEQLLRDEKAAAATRENQLAAVRNDDDPSRLYCTACFTGRYPVLHEADMTAAIASSD